MSAVGLKSRRERKWPFNKVTSHQRGVVEFRMKNFRIRLTLNVFPVYLHASIQRMASTLVVLSKRDEKRGLGYKNTSALCGDPRARGQGALSVHGPRYTRHTRASPGLTWLGVAFGVRSGSGLAGWQQQQHNALATAFWEKSTPRPRRRITYFFSPRHPTVPLLHATREYKTRPRNSRLPVGDWNQR